jgi:hypothetical protein
MYKKLDIGWTAEEIRPRLDQYTRKELNDKLRDYVMHFLGGEKDWLLSQESYIAHAAETAMKMTPQQRNPKYGITNYVLVPFLHPECFRRFVNYLPEATQKILEHIVLEGATGNLELEEKYDVVTWIPGDKKNWQGRYSRIESPELRLFTCINPDRSYYTYDHRELIFVMPDGVRQLIAHLLYPVAPTIHPFSPDPNNNRELIFRGGNLIQEELPGLLIRLQQKPVRTTKKGRPNISSVRSIRKKLAITEFYPFDEDERFANIRSSALVGMLATSVQRRAYKGHELIKRLFSNEFITNFHLPVHLFNYIEEIGKVREYHLENQGKRYLDLIKKLPANTWVNYEELEFSLKTQLFDAFPIDFSGMYHLCLIAKNAEGERRQVNVYPHNTGRLILWPALRAALFVMASWGIVDLIYQKPDLSRLPGTADSPYDGIKAFRITDLGAYMLGMSKEYVSRAKPPFRLELAEDSLSILLTEGDQSRAALAIASFAKPFGKKRFYTDAKLFLGDCKSPEELEHKISIFRSVFSEELPDNWQAFFDEISQKVNPLEAERAFSVFRVDPDNRALLQLIARDPELKRLCLKAEGFLILIAKKDINKFKKRLQTFGYLLE